MQSHKSDSRLLHFYRGQNTNVHEKRRLPDKQRTPSPSHLMSRNWKCRISSMILLSHKMRPPFTSLDIPLNLTHLSNPFTSVSTLSSRRKTDAFEKMRKNRCFNNDRRLRRKGRGENMKWKLAIRSFYPGTIQGLSAALQKTHRPWQLTFMYHRLNR